MASLKEIKIRIASIRNTQKITSAMRMVSSAKLHHAQTVMENMLIYQQKLFYLLQRVMTADENPASPYTIQRKIKQVAIVAFSSNSGLCGSFNANAWKTLHASIQQLEKEHISVLLFPIGKKIADNLRKDGYKINEQFIQTGDKPSYENTSGLANELIRLFKNGEVDRVDLLFHHFKNRAEQVITRKTFLPVTLPERNQDLDQTTDYIIEPSSEQLVELLLPKVLHINIYADLLDNLTAEHASRMLAMQTADDNANDLIQDISLQFNKTRQQAITNELLDIMGGISQK